MKEDWFCISCGKLNMKENERCMECRKEGRTYGLLASYFTNDSDVDSGAGCNG